MALNTDYALRTGAFDPIKGQTVDTLDQDALKDQALLRYNELKVSIIRNELQSSGKLVLACICSLVNFY